MSLIFLILLYLLLSTTGLMLVKIGFNQFRFETYHLEEYRRFLKYAYHHPEFIFGFLLYILSFVSWLILLSKKQLTTILKEPAELNETTQMESSEARTTI